jgi:two-component system LytT family response regulator
MAVQKLKAIIIDDEGPNIDTLDKILSVYCPGVIVVARCKDPVEAIDLVKELKPHMVFLDITMPEMNGFDFLKSFNEITFKVVFTTAYSEYALKAIKYAAFDYLLKPINYEEVIDTVNRIKAETQKPMAARISTPSNAVNNLAVPTTEGFHFVDIHEIIYCKSDNSYTNLILKDGK